MASISNTDDTIDIRDVIARVEELRSECAELEDAINLADGIDEIDESRARYEDWQGAHADELGELEALLAECKGNGGDEQWEGDWYPVTLIRGSYFETYAQELADDIGAIQPGAAWPNNCIDWEKAARELQQDYTGIEFDDITYWVR